jgi:hypothetical protein
MSDQERLKALAAERKRINTLTRQANEAAWGCTLSLTVHRGYMKAKVTGLDKDMALSVRQRFQSAGWSATAKSGYTEVHAERKV